MTMLNEMISEKFPFLSQYAEIYQAKLHYIEVGKGDPILFLHGIPTSSYLWRNVIPHLSTLGRCVALDLPGFGQSDKPNIEYTILDYIKYVEKFIETLNLKNITFIMHGFGSVICFDYEMRHEKNCKGLVFYEAFLRPFSDQDVSLPFQEQLLALQENEYDIVMHGDLFVDKIIPQTVMRALSTEEMNHYREPFKQKGTGKPIFQYFKELIKVDHASELNKVIENYSNKLAKSSLPKLMLYSVPGFITTIATVMWAKEHLSQLEIVEIGEELHLAQESYPERIGEVISIWLQGVEQNV